MDSTANYRRLRMTTTTCPLSIVAALLAAETMPGMGRGRVWQSDNDDQAAFLNQFWGQTRAEMIADLMDAIASWDVSVVNKFLRDRGFTIQLNELPDNTFAAAAVLDLLVEWVVRGTATTFMSETTGQQYPAVRLEKTGLSFFNGPSGPAVMIPTNRSADKVLMMAQQSVSPGVFGLMDDARRLLRAVDSDYLDTFGGLVFPMVKVRQQVDIGWLLGLRTIGDDGRPAVISQALQENRLRMNEVGAHAQSATAVAVTRGGGGDFKPDLRITDPFLVVFFREGVGPLFAAHITPEDWKNPGDIAA